MKRVVCIYNPMARRGPQVDRLRAALDGLDGWEASLVQTEAAQHATELARRAAAQQVDTVLVCGGDGTVNEAANGLAGSATALAVVRGGTSNVWAKEAGVPKDPVKAVRLVAEGERRRIDLGRAGERYFLLLASGGLDADTIRRVAPGLKSRFGAAAFLVTGIRNTFRYRGRYVELLADGEVLSGELYTFLLGNTRSYGGVLNIAQRAQVDDGRLDLYLLRKGGLHRMLWLALKVLLRRHERDANVVYSSIKQVSIETAGMPAQVDGEYIGETPLRFEVAPGALEVIVPRGLRSPLFGSTAGDGGETV
jgi:YegS/Rv2252/BmrU family lipid kinase